MKYPRHTLAVNLMALSIFILCNALLHASIPLSHLIYLTLSLSQCLCLWLAGREIGMSTETTAFDCCPWCCLSLKTKRYCNAAFPEWNKKVTRSGPVVQGSEVCPNSSTSSESGASRGPSAEPALQHVIRSANTESSTVHAILLYFYQSTPCV